MGIKDIELWLENGKYHIFLIFTAAIFLFYGNVLFNGFVYDDHYLIVSNHLLREGFPFFSFFKESTAGVYYRPVSMCFLAIGYKLWGLSSFGFHLSNILLHLANTYLVFLILKSITRDRLLSFIAALFFAVHPIHVEAVTPIYDYMGLLSTFFSLASFLEFVKSDNMRRIKNSFLCVAFFILAVFSKEDALILPAIFLLYDIYFISKFHWRNISGKWKPFLPILIAGGVYLLVRALIFKSKIATGFIHLDGHWNIFPPATATGYLLVGIKTVSFYAALLMFPLGLTVFHVISPVSALGDVDVILSVGVMLILLFSVVYFSRRNLLASFFMAMFLILVFPISNIVPMGGRFSERFMYFPSVCYCFFISAIFCFFIRRYAKVGSWRKTLVFALLFVMLCSYGLQTVIRNYVWRSDMTLWRDAVTQSPSYVSHYGLGSAYYHLGLYDKALAQFQLALKFPSGQEDYLHDLIGRIYSVNGQYEYALEEFQKALRLNSRFVEAYYNIGITYFYINQLDLSFSYFQKACALDEKYPWGYYGLGLIYEKRGQGQAAVKMMEKALEFDSEFLPAKRGLERIKG